MKNKDNVLTQFLTRCLLAVACVFALGVNNTKAVLPFEVSDKNGDLDPAHASWTGDGTVQGNLFPGTWNGTGDTNKDVLVDDFSEGTFTIKPGSLYPNPRISTDQGVSVTTSLTGGTGDLVMVNSTNYDDSASMYNSIAMTDLQGVTSITMTFNFVQPIAARSDFTTIDLDSFPVGAALGLVSAGSGLALSDFNVAMSFGQVYSDANDDGVFIAGVPGTAQPLISGGWAGTSNTPVYGAGGATSFSSSGFTGLIDVLGVGDQDFLMVRGWDLSGGSSYSPTDEADLVYISSLTWTITPNDGMTFAAGTEFTISMDGQQHANLDAVPEPSSWLLVGFACVGGVLLSGRRARRTA